MRLSKNINKTLLLAYENDTYTINWATYKVNSLKAAIV